MTEIPGAPPSRLSLAPRFRAMLERMVDPYGQYDDSDRSRMAQAVIAHALNRGFATDAIEDLLLDPRNELSAWAFVHRRQGRQRTDADARRHVQTSIAASIANPASPNHRPAISSRSEGQHVIGEWRGMVAGLIWNGRDSSLLAVLTHLGDIATRAGSVEVSASSRQLAEACGVGQRTAARAVQRALEEGWVQLITTGSARSRESNITSPHLLAPVYRLAIPYQEVLDARSPCAKGDSVATEELRVRRTEPLLARHDAFAWRALGKSCHRLYGLLTEQSRTHGELVALTGFHRDTVRRALDRLLAADLLASDSDGRFHLVAHDLDAVAALYGTAGVGEARRRRHETERAAASAALDEARIARWRVKRRAEVVRLVTRALGDQCVVPDTAELIWQGSTQVVIDLRSGEILCAA